MLSIAERLLRLQELMKAKKIDIYIVPTADFHQSEYVGEYFKARAFLTGFTGSAGTAVITQTAAGLWTDGRYFVQAADQLDGTPVVLFKSGEPGVPSVTEYIRKTLPEGGTLGFDGRLVSKMEGVEYEKIAAKKKGRISDREDLTGQIWADRPSLSKEKVFALEERYTGESAASKLRRIREAMVKHHANTHILTSLEDICWIFNIRGGDIHFLPLVLCYAVITMDHVNLYIDEEKLSSRIKADLIQDKVVFCPYHKIYEDVRGLEEDRVLLIDPAKINYAIYRDIPDSVEVVEAPNPEILFKAVKNETEIENIRMAELKDSICHVKFMKWLKENYNKTTITELSASAKLDELREAQGNYIGPSFAPICAYAKHSACPHYESSPKTDVMLKDGNFFLTDTGAGFLEGSTDITRTYALGNVSLEMKEHFTLVAVSNLRLASARFLYGATGLSLDIMARKPFWDRDLNFKHGTGHGVGYLLNIHEGPAGFHWKYYRPGDLCPLEAGMVITDEPGIYFEGSYGVRLENELLVRQGNKNEYGQFMFMEPLTYVPFDLDAIEPGFMTAEDKELLNAYHRLVYEKVSGSLDEEEKEWLKVYTREIE